MKTKSILIADNSEIITIGISSILCDLDNTNIDIVHSISELRHILNNNNIDILIVNPNLFQNKKSEIDLCLSNDSKYDIIILCENECLNLNDIEISDHISYQDSKSEIISKIVGIYEKRSSKNSKLNSNLLSKREINILKHIALGLSNKEIADKLYISIHTVITHRKNITAKLEIKSVAGLTVYAILNNIIDVNNDEVL
ncbi:MAG: LuxR C-terminal-related transcriptional regulator [Marinifilaceae bacterium]|jgi:DNA-binding NarL/FixJ family response regulator|nr:LuxR C-terminal-related transcriptional regulator [Marinifilaceae bacterium]